MNAQVKEDTRDKILQHVTDMLNEYETAEGPVSATKIAKSFKIASPTVQYHMDHLVNEGKLVDTGHKSGKQRIYRLPMLKKVFSLDDNAGFMQKLMDVKNRALASHIQPAHPHEHSQNLDNSSVMSREIHDQLEGVDTGNAKTKADLEITPEIEDLKVEEPIEQLDLNKEHEEEINEISSLDEAKPEEDPMLHILEDRENSLEEQIDDFLGRAKSIPSAENILQQNDREILAVVNETIHQNILYLQDLTQQLSTVQDKRFVQTLIDDRNSNLQTIEEMKQQIQSMRDQILLLQAENKKHQEAINLDRVKFMYGRIVHTVDSFVDLPNQSMALKKNEFRKQHTKELNDFYRYIAQIDQ
jgi:biotin operon repressor